MKVSPISVGIINNNRLTMYTQRRIVTSTQNNDVYPEAHSYINSEKRGERTSRLSFDPPIVD
jgi:hypothetical protein